MTDFPGRDRQFGTELLTAQAGSGTAPKMKTLEFEHLDFILDCKTGKFTVVNEENGEKITFDLTGLTELRAALRHFGIQAEPGSMVNYR